MNLAHIIDDAPDSAIALIYRNENIDFAMLRQRVADLRSGLAANGIERGDRVVVVCGNSDLFVVAYLAILGLGAIAVPLNPASPAPELTRQTNVVSPKAAIVGRAGVSAWAGLEPDAVADLMTIVAEPNPALEGARLWSDIERSDPVPVVEMNPDDAAVMMFTSGTAGAPKAAILSHKNLLANIEHIEEAPDRISSGDIVYGVLPLFHIFGLNVQLAVSLRFGATLLLVQRFDPMTALDSIQQRKVTVIPGAPAMWTAFSQMEDVPADAFATVRLAYSGASKLSTRVAADLLERFGLAIGEGYGLTEASPVVTSSAGIPHRIGSCGKAVAGVEVAIVDPERQVVPVGDTGEVIVRGDNVFSGYLDHPEATERVLTDDGWLKTGDIGFCDEDGYLYLVDRAKDLIIVSGFNVFPAEVEETLNGHPAVAESAVIGVPHPHTGEAVRAYVVAADSNVDEETLIEYCQDHLARYKTPSKVMFVEALPRNASGKLVRQELTNTVMADS